MTTYSRLERAFQRDVIEYLKSQGIWCLNTVGSATSQGGTPDIIACVNGHFVAFELKREDGSYKADTRQKLTLKRISNNGGIALVINSLDDVKSIISKLSTCNH